MIEHPRGEGGGGAAKSGDHPEAHNPEVEHPRVEGEQAAASRQEQEAGRVWANYSDYRDSLLYKLVVICGGLLAIGMVFIVVARPVIEHLAPHAGSFFRRFGEGATFWGFPSNTEESREFFKRFATYLMCSFSNLFLLAVCPLVLKNASLTTWLLLVNSYAHRLAVYRAQDARFLHGFDLMTIGLSGYFNGLHHRRTIGKYIVRYWFVVLVACSILWPPGESTRFDENPPDDVETRVRVNLIEAAFIVIWLAAAERLMHPQIMLEDGFAFLNSWALLVFLLHKAIHITIIFPLNWIVLVLLGPACWWVENRKQ